MVKNAENLEKRVYKVPEDIDSQIAQLKLEAMNIHIDELTDEQIAYLNSWEEGT
jgi:adenosylhomocysteinase